MVTPKNNAPQQNKGCNNYNNYINFIDDEILVIFARWLLSLYYSTCIIIVQALPHLLQALTTVHDAIADI